jgi:hypothetical protein
MNAGPPSQSVTVSKPQKPPRLREARFEDYPQVAALVSKFDLQMESREEWMHLWTDNPAYREIKGKFPMGWVLETADGAIAGYLGNVPLHYEFEGKVLLAATTRAWVVDTPYRSFSTLLLATYFQQRDVDLFLSTTVNALSEPVYRTFQGIPAPRGAWDRTLFWITNHRGFVKSFLINKRSALAAPLSYPLSLGLFLRDLVKGSRLPDLNTLEVASCSSFDDRFDSFWPALREKRSKLLLGIRSREALAWHFKFALQQNRAWIFTIEGTAGDGRAMIAYSIFLRSDHPPIGLTRMRLVDFQCLDAERSMELLKVMLHAASNRCRQESIQMIELVGCTPEVEKALESASPHRRALSSWLYCYKARDPQLAEKLGNPAVWEPSLFDGDSSL